MPYRKWLLCISLGCSGTCISQNKVLTSHKSFKMDLFRKTQKKDVHDSEILNAVAGTLKISLIEMNEFLMI